MANTYTTILQLAKPTAGDVNWDDEVNGNSDKIDELLWQRYLAPTTEVTATVLGAGAVGAFLTPSTQYFYRVTGTNAQGETDTLVEADATEGVTARPIQINWTAIAGATGYNVYKGTTSGSLFLLATLGVTTVYTDDGTVATTGTPYPTGNSATVLTEADTVDGFHASSTPTANYILPLEGTGKYAAADGSLITNINVPEVIAARGTALTLDARLDVTLNDDGTLIDNIVTTPKINALAVTTAKLDDLSVTTAKIVDLNVTTAKINTLAVTTAKIDDQAVISTKIADLNVTTIKIADQNVTTAKIADGNVTTIKITDDAVTSQKLADADGSSGQVTSTGSGVKTGHIQNDAVTEPKILDGSVTVNKLGALAVTTTKIDNSAVTSDKVAAGFQVGFAVGTNNVASTSTNVIPNDNTIPQQTEGTEVVTVSITPKSATNKLRVQAAIHIQGVNGSTTHVIALFRDSGADALATSYHGSINGENTKDTMILDYTLTAGSTAATTFKIRAGSASANPLGINGTTGGVAEYGGTLVSSVTVTEIKA